MRPKWTFEDALPIIRAIDPIARRCNFSLALRGGVLLRGESDRDLDLCFLSEGDLEFCLPEMVLEEIAKVLSDQIDHYGELYFEGTHPYAVIWLRDGRHIDAHFWI
jgi:hypothetical protein